MVTKDTLIADLAQMTAKRDADLAQLNALIGQIAYVERLLALWDAPDPPKDA